MQCVGSIVHLRNVNRSQNTKPEVTFMSWQEVPRRVMRPWSLNCIFFSPGRWGMLCLTGWLAEATPNQYYSMNPWCCDSRWRKWPLLQSLCHADPDKNLECQFGVGLGRSAIAVALARVHGSLKVNLCLACGIHAMAPSHPLLRAHHRSVRTSSSLARPHTTGMITINVLPSLRLSFLPNGTCSICSTPLSCS